MFSKGHKINDRYEIIKSIGEGGMANVYLANDNILDRQVAVKVLRGDLSGDQKFVRRFEREALSVSKLSHPNIVEVYDVGEEEGQQYIVMEYIEGKTLKQLIQKRGTLTLPETVDIMSQLTDGLAHAHEAYIIHRDIKPQNIMILANGVIKITDFGIAMATNSTQLTQTNSVMGSVHYLPPEQANGKGSTIKSDIYSLGILMYELLTGVVPFKGDTAVEIALKQLKEKLPSIRKQNPTIPQSIENIVLKATAKNPRNRYDNVREMYNDLQVALDKDNEKRYVYPYPENDLDDTKVAVKPSERIAKPVKEDNITSVEVGKDNVVNNKKKKNDKNQKKIIIIVVIAIILISTITILVLKGGSNKTIIVPDVVNMDINKAISKLEKMGFDYDIITENSEDFDEDLVIKTVPKAGSKRKKGNKIKIYQSLGIEHILLEDYTGKDFAEIKAKLELLGIHVIKETKTIEDTHKYAKKEDIIIDQNPVYNKKEQVKLTEGDTVTLYVPDIVNKYPDMVLEKWSLSDAEAFAEEYKINLNIEYEETDSYEPGIVIYQNRPAGDTIISGVSLRIKVSKEKTNSSKKEEDIKTDNE